MRRFTPQYFEKDISTGVPKLTPEGLKVIEEELQEESEHQVGPATPRGGRSDLAAAA